MDPDLWRPVQDHCDHLGPQFRFLHVEQLAGAKAGALNWAMPHTDPAATIIGVVDADYHVEPDGNSTLLMLCAPDEDGVPAEDRLLRPQRGMHRFEWPDDPTVEFHLGHGDWIRLLRGNHFDVGDLIKLWPPGSGSEPSCAFVTADWASRWPCEEVWRARRHPTARSPRRSS